MTKVFETFVLTFLAIAFIRGYHLMSGRTMPKSREHRLQKAESNVKVRL